MGLPVVGRLRALGGRGEELGKALVEWSRGKGAAAHVWAGEAAPARGKLHRDWLQRCP